MFVLQRGRGNVRKYWECVELVYFVKQCVYKGNPKVEEKSEEETEDGEDDKRIVPTKTTTKYNGNGSGGGGGRGVRTSDLARYPHSKYPILTVCAKGINKSVPAN